MLRTPIILLLTNLTLALIGIYLFMSILLSVNYSIASTVLFFVSIVAGLMGVITINFTKKYLGSFFKSKTHTAGEKICAAVYVPIGLIALASIAMQIYFFMVTYKLTFETLSNSK